MPPPGSRSRFGSKESDGARSEDAVSNTGSNEGTSVQGVRKSDKSLSIDDFSVLSKLGEGGFGTVLLVRKKGNGKLYALKVLVKKNMTKSGDAKRAIGESIAMQEIKHPFIVQLHYAFQDTSHIYFVLEFVGGGDLFSHLERGTFPEKWCKVYLAEVALAVDHVHSHDFVYRDLKPENVLVGSDGHLVLADFGLAKKLGSKRGGRLNTVIGTPSLLAPEVFLEKDYGFSVDWWALGLLFCEMLMGETPIVEEEEEDLHSLIEHFKNGTHLQPMPKWVSKEAADLIKRLLTVPRDKRMCCGPEGFAELKRHPFFAGIDWDALYRKELDAPLRPFAVAGALGSSDGHGDDKTPKSKEVAELENYFVDFTNEDDPTATNSAWSSLLCEAAAAGNIDELRAHVRQGAPVDVSDYDQRTAMHLVCSEGRLEMVSFLVEEAGASISPQDRWGGTPLDDAIRHKHQDIVQYLMSRGARKGTGRLDPTTADLCDAAAQEDIDHMKRLVESGVDVNKGDYDKRTPIHVAASDGKVASVKFLVSVGADVSPIDRWGGTPLDDAVRANHTEAAAFLLSVNAKKGTGKQDTTQADLCEAAAHGDLERLRKLITGGADVNKGDYDRRTALHLAASEGHSDSCRFLVQEAHAEVNPEDRWGNTPLDDAIRSKKKEVVELLTAAHAVKGKGTMKPSDNVQADLCEAASRGDIKLLRELTGRGVDVNAGDYDKRTAIHLAASEGLLPVVKFLVEEARASTSPIDRWGGTPLDDAIRAQHAEVIVYLAGKGGKKGTGKQEPTVADLCEASSKGDMDQLRMLVEQGVKVNKGDYDRRTALHLAASEGLLPVVRFLVEEAHAHDSPIDRWGNTPLDDAVRSHHDAVADYLRERGAKTSAKLVGGVSPMNGHLRDHTSDQSQSMDLCGAASQRNLIALRVLIAQGCNVNAGDYDRRTAIHIGASEGFLDVVELLVDEGRADVSPVDRWSYTPLDDAMRSQHAAVVEYLLSKGAQQGAGHQERSVTDVCSAAYRGDLGTLRMLVDQGMDVDAGDYDKRTPIHLAASEGLLPVVKFLVVEAGCDVNPIDRWGSTPLDDALRHRHRTVAEYLTSVGARKKESALDRLRNFPKRAANSTRWSSGSRGRSQSSNAAGAGDARLRLADRGHPRGSAASTASDDGETSVVSTKSDLGAQAPLGGALHRPRRNKPRLRPMLPIVPKAEDRLVCPLAGRRFEEPVVAHDGFTYERSAIMEWFDQHGLFSPLTGQPMESMLVLPNTTLKELGAVLDAGTAYCTPPSLQIQSPRRASNGRKGTVSFADDKPQACPPASYVPHPHLGLLPHERSVRAQAHSAPMSAASSPVEAGSGTRSDSAPARRQGSGSLLLRTVESGLLSRSLRRVSHGRSRNSSGGLGEPLPARLPSLNNTGARRP